MDARELLHYFTHSTAGVADASKSEAVRKIHNRVSKIKTDDAVGGEFLTTLYHDFDMRWEGKTIRLIKQICKKLRKSTLPEVIADELEEDVKFVEKICNIAKDYAPDYDESAVYCAVEKAGSFQ